MPRIIVTTDPLDRRDTAPDQGETAVLFDGGIRTGLDVLKALALGARACLLGRAWALPLAAGGQQALADRLEGIRAELRTAMVLTGCPSVQDAGPHLVRTAPH